MRLYGLLEGQVRICVQSMWQTRGIQGHTLPGNFVFDLLLDAIWWNLVLFLHKHNSPFIVSLSFYKGLNRFTCKIEVSAYPRGRGGGQAKAKGGGRQMQRNPARLANRMKGLLPFSCKT